MRVAYGGHGVAELADGAAVPCLFRRRVGRPCCGDRVQLIPADDGAWVVEEILPRDNAFLRADARGRTQVVAANLDQVLVTLANRPLPSRDLLDRYLVAVHSLGIEPVIVRNKVDLPVDESAPGADSLARLDDYRALGFPVAETCCKGPPGIDELEPLVTGRTSIFVGQSGVGKSSLINRLVPDRDVQTGALSRVTGKGTHTTTTTMLYHLPAGGSLMDSPGVWEFGLWRLEPEAIAAGFPDFAPFLGACRFNDCRHASEPGCAVKSAVAAGEIAGWRHDAYLRLLAQNDTVSSR
jgi:ribosome biogenesis GTPase